MVVSQRNWRLNLEKKYKNAKSQCITPTGHLDYGSTTDGQLAAVVITPPNGPTISLQGFILGKCSFDDSTVDSEKKSGNNL